MTEKVIFLAFDNPKASPSDHDMLACASCRNKTYRCRTDLGEWPELYCAACGSRIGAFGWAEQEQLGRT